MPSNRDLERILEAVEASRTAHREIPTAERIDAEDGSTAYAWTSPNETVRLVWGPSTEHPGMVEVARYGQAEDAGRFYWAWESLVEYEAEHAVRSLIEHVGMLR